MTRAFRRSAAGLAIVGTVALIAGCGGGSDDSLSADEFRTQADAICADANRQSDALSSPTEASQYLTFLQQTKDLQAASLDKLKALKPPSDLKTTWDEAIALQDQQAAALDTAITRIDGGEGAEAVLSDIGTEVSARDTELDAKAKTLGLTVCGSDADGATATTDTTATTAETTIEAPTAPATTTGETTASIPTTGDPAIDQYVADAQEAAGALTTFGTLLQSVTSAPDLKAKAPEAQQALDEFDAAIAKLDGYNLDNATLEKQRAGLVSEGPAVSDTLRRFVDAAASGDEAAVQSLLPEVMTALQNFSSAATDVS